MRAGISALVVVLLGSVVRVAPAAEGTWFVVPGKRGVPVIVNPLGFDASYQVVERDFGLDRPDQVNPTIVGPHILPPPYYPTHYFPHGGRVLGYGRLEILPPGSSRRTQTPQSFERSWTAESDPLPATIDNPNPYPLNVDVNAGWGGGWNRDRRRWDRDRDRDHRRGPNRPGRNHSRR